MLFDSARTSATMKTVAGVQIIYTAIKKTVFEALNTFLKDTTNTSLGFEFQIDFLCNNSDDLLGLVCENGIHKNACVVRT